MNGFEQAIKAYLDERASIDALFAQTYAKKEKSIEECCRYIIQEVKKTNRQGFADEEIFSMAIHYYDEDNIKVDKTTPQCNVVTNKATKETFKPTKSTKPTPQPKTEPKAEGLFSQPQEQTKAEPTKKPTKKEKALQDQLSLF